VAVVGVLVGSGGFVTAAFRWLAKRDDRREAERTAERQDYVASMKSIHEHCTTEMRSISADFKQERALDRESRKEHHEILRAAVARLNNMPPTELQ